MAVRKYITFEEMMAYCWFSRTRWKALGVIIPEDAIAKDFGWKPVPGVKYPVFSADQGVMKDGSPVDLVDMKGRLVRKHIRPEVPDDIAGTPVETVYRAAARYKQVLLPFHGNYVYYRPPSVQVHFDENGPHPYAYFGDEGIFYVHARLRPNWMDAVHKRGLDRLPYPITVKRIFVVDAGPWTYGAGAYACEAKWIKRGGGGTVDGWIAWRTGGQEDQVVAYGLGCTEKRAVARLRKEIAAQASVAHVPVEDASAMEGIF